MGWAVNKTPRPIYPREWPGYTLCRSLSEPQGRSGRVRKISPLTGTRSSECLVHGESLYRLLYICLFLALQPPQWARTSSFTRFLDHTKRCTTVDRTPLEEWSARRRDLYLTAHNTHNRQTSMPLAAFEPTIWACEWPQTHALRPRCHWDRRLRHIACENRCGFLSDMLTLEDKGTMLLRNVGNQLPSDTASYLKNVILIYLLTYLLHGAESFLRD